MHSYVAIRHVKLQNELKLPKSMKTGERRGMNIAQKLWDGTVGSHSCSGSTPLNSNPGTKLPTQYFV